MSPISLQENLKKYTCTEQCPVRNVVARFSGKWAILILCVLSENETTRFNAIAKAIPDISPKVLTATLKNLEKDKLIRREVFAEIPPRVEYSLTDLGKSLMPHIENLLRWAIDNFESVTRR